MSLLCAGVISPSNAPLHVQVFAPPGGAAGAGGGGESSDDDGNLNTYLHVLHCSLDVVEERLRATTIKTASGGNAGGAVTARTMRRLSILHPPFSVRMHVLHAYSSTAAVDADAAACTRHCLKGFSRHHRLISVLKAMKSLEPNERTSKRDWGRQTLRDGGG